MKTLVVVYDYFPATNAPANRWFRLRNELGDLDIEVITSTKCDHCNDKDITRLRPLVLGKKRNFINSFITWIYFALRAALIISVRRKKYDNVIYSSPNIFVTFPLAIRKSIYSIVEVRDLWPETISAVSNLSKSSLVYRLLVRYVARIYRKSDVIVVVTETMRNTLEKDYLVPSDKIRCIPNGIIYRDIPELSKKTELTLNFIYAGTIGLSQDLPAFIRHMKESKVKFNCSIAGKGEDLERLLEEIEEDKRFRYLGFLKEEELELAIADAEFFIVPLRDDPIFYGALPSKIHDAGFRGLPVLYNISGELDDVMEKYNAGWKINSHEDFEMFATSISLKKYLNKRFGIRELVRSYSIENSAQRYKNLLS